MIKKISIAVVLLIPAVVMLVFFIQVAMAPINKMNELHQFVYSDSTYIQEFDSMYYQPEMSELLIEKAYKDALLSLSTSDSIQLVVNLSDSTVDLSIKGVTISETKFTNFEVDELFNRLTLPEKIKLFSQPLNVCSQFATIVKEPVVVRQAPKDTLEAAQNAWQPDTLIQNPAFAEFVIEHDIKLILEQDNNTDPINKRAKRDFYNVLYKQTLKVAINNFKNHNKQEYQPVIIIELPVDVVRAIYRALPENPLVVIKL